MIHLTLKRRDFGGEDVFSPAGSNILAGENIMLNTHCFVGYFTNL
jgi:acetyltransferase-like isoleucine patch superfamily enzyme